MFFNVPYFRWWMRNLEVHWKIKGFQLVSDFMPFYSVVYRPVPPSIRKTNATLFMRGLHQLICYQLILWGEGGRSSSGSVIYMACVTKFHLLSTQPTVLDEPFPSHNLAWIPANYTSIERETTIDSTISIIAAYIACDMYKSKFPVILGIEIFIISQKSYQGVTSSYICRWIKYHQVDSAVQKQGRPQRE